tara:strand:- start:1762 stop:1980 length:219 start_codon:yes stop_codon:yes gene_type:complete
MTITQSFNSLQKSAILKIIEMNNDELMGFLEISRISISFIDLQKNAIQKIYQMNINELENIIKEDECYDELL